MIAESDGHLYKVWHIYLTYKETADPEKQPLSWG